VTEIATFVCSICAETSLEICIYCTKDTCANHLCVRCRRCSDCCECEFPLTASEPESASLPPTQPEPLPPTVPEPLPPGNPEPTPQPWPDPMPPGDPEPVPGTDPQPETPGPMATVEVEVFEVVEEAPVEPEAVETEAAEPPTAHDDLVRSLPELFAPEKKPAPAYHDKPEETEE